MSEKSESEGAISTGTSGVAHSLVKRENSASSFLQEPGTQAVSMPDIYYLRYPVLARLFQFRIPQ